MTSPEIALHKNEVMTRQVKRVKSQKRYPEELKRKIAKSYIAGEASYAVLAEENELKNKGVVKEFVKWYRKILEKESQTQEILKDDEKTDKTTSGEPNLQAQLKALQKQLALSELKVEALETMIDLAEEELKIPIRKKSGSKQPKK